MPLARRLQALLVALALLSAPALARAVQHLEARSGAATISSFSHGVDAPPKRGVFVDMLAGVVVDTFSAGPVGPAVWPRHADAPSARWSSPIPLPRPFRAPPLS